VSVLSAVPGLHAAACPAAAAALGATGIGPVCQVASAATGAVGSAASSVAGFGIDSVLGGLGTWVAQGASWLLGQIGSVIAETTSVDLGASWFGAHYRTMAELAGVVIVPLLLLGIVQSIYRQNLSSLLRSVLVNVPLALLLTAVAVTLVQLGLSLTDSMSSAVAHGAGLDSGHFMSSVLVGLSGTSVPSGQPSVPAFVLFVGALAVVVGAVLVWVELLIRAAAVYVAVLFLPLALASLAWPAIAHWCRRLVDTLVALILGKFVIVSVLSLAAGALAGGTGSTPSGATGSAASASAASASAASASAASAFSSASTSSGGGSFTAVLGGAALLMLSAFAPWALFRLLPFVEAGAVGHLEGLSRQARQTASAPMRTLAHTAMQKASAAAVNKAGVAMAGSALGGVLGGAGGGSGGGGGEGSGGGSSGGGGGGGSGSSTDGGSPSAGPDLGPSSAEATGVGTMDPPGSSIPRYPIHVAASEVGNGDIDLAEDHAAPGRWTGPAGSGPSAASPGPGSSAVSPELIPLPRATGTFRAAALGRDRLGIKLIDPSQAPPDRPDDPGPAR
jgi:hypothetical protein